MHDRKDFGFVFLVIVVFTKNDRFSKLLRIFSQCFFKCANFLLYSFSSLGSS